MEFGDDNISFQEGIKQNHKFEKAFVNKASTDTLILESYSLHSKSDSNDV